MESSHLCHFFGLRKCLDGELNSPVVEWLNKGLMSVPSPNDSWVWRNTFGPLLGELGFTWSEYRPRVGDSPPGAGGASAGEKATSAGGGPDDMYEADMFVYALRRWNDASANSSEQG
eukprot:2331435-Pyramimonas_sp.AAC.1